MPRIAQQTKRLLQRHETATNLARAVYRSYLAILREGLVLTRVVPRIVRSRLLGSRSDWKKSLPVQTPSHFAIGWGTAPFHIDLARQWCISQNLPYGEGADAFYLPPITWSRSPLASFQRLYPADCGLKISREAGGCSNLYLTPREGRASTQRRFSYSHHQQILVLNLLYSMGVGPRLFDLVELIDGTDVVWTAYVVEHFEGGPPSSATYDRIIGKLKDLAAAKLICLIGPHGWRADDFRKPDCNGNLIEKPDGRAAYIDIHNFVLDRYDQHLEALARRVAATSHFGGRSCLLGGLEGEFLYQEIPGTDLPAKRSPSERMLTYDKLAQDAGITFRNSVVFDVGCNLGLMGAEYLRREARWLHGWDMPEMVSAAEAVLLSTGCTRFSLTPGRLSGQSLLFDSLPAHIKDTDRQAGIVNYLAIRGHVGWMSALKGLPWRYMIYEGHQNDEDLDAHLPGLAALVPIRVLARGTVEDANTKRRDAAIIERLE